MKILNVEFFNSEELKQKSRTAVKRAVRLVVSNKNNSDFSRDILSTSRSSQNNERTVSRECQKIVEVAG